MEYETIRFKVKNDVAVLTLNRPDAKNALNTQMRAEILHAIKAAEQAARALVITGRGAVFCAGQDLGDQAQIANIDLERTLREEYDPLFQAIFNCRIPTVSAVNGAAAGVGASLALATDVVIASETAVFVQAFSKIGLMPDGGSTWWLPRQVGSARAMGMALFAEPVTAQQAADWGMIWEAVPDAVFADHWLNRAEQLAAGPTKSFRQIKTAIRGSWENTLEAQLDIEAKLQGRCGQTRDFKEGVVSFLENRKATFEGR
ncbi:enoyl-CoA hydratase-related protein [Halocynthiibacter namhaensis]|uniref:enoyl-CoA hydratase-related protein n=1 Tax=Halocynthiibacter namhaensis TaxID=1290553 RepID=UPI0005791DD7|nr:enoyl-CoA hydratase-related protein [Halocynthiibacter namhaensis]